MTFRQRYFMQPLSGARPGLLFALLWRYGGCDAAFLPRLAVTLAASLPAGPLGLLQRRKIRRGLDEAPPMESPVFVLGHWRSGTTHLHNLLMCDPRHAAVSTMQALAPDLFYIAPRLVRAYMRLAMPSKRPQDNMDLTPDSPAEEEIALAKQSPLTIYHQWSFPRDMTAMRRCAFPEEMTAAEHADWAAAYRGVLDAAHVAGDGRRLVLKNPANTAKLRSLRELFPEARFIHIVRDPFEVFLSMRHMHAKLLAVSALQHYNEAALDGHIFEVYRRMMRAYLDAAKDVPAGQLCEVRFEDLARRPEQELERVYTELGMDYEPARDPVAAYAAGQRDYRRNRYERDPELLRRVMREWEFACEAWGYPGS